MPLGMQRLGWRSLTIETNVGRSMSPVRLTSQFDQVFRARKSITTTLDEFYRIVIDLAPDCVNLPVTACTPLSVQLFGLGADFLCD